MIIKNTDDLDELNINDIVKFVVNDIVGKGRITHINYPLYTARDFTWVCQDIETGDFHGHYRDKQIIELLYRPLPMDVIVENLQLL